jgi:hypothetical protein
MQQIFDETLARGACVPRAALCGFSQTGARPDMCEIPEGLDFGIRSLGLRVGLGPEGEDDHDEYRDQRRRVAPECDHDHDYDYD